MKCTGHAGCLEKMRGTKELVRKSERKSRLERPGRGWKDNVKMDLQETE